MLAEKHVGGSSSAPPGARPLSSASTAPVANDQPSYLGWLELLEPHVEARLLRTIRRAVKDMVEIKLSALADKVAEKKKALADTLVDKEKALAGKDEVIAAKDDMLEAVKHSHMLLINQKMNQLAVFKAQYHACIMIDILYDGLESAPAFDGKLRGKWQLLLRNVLRDDKLTEAAMADLKDLDGSKDLPTVVSDLESLSNRLSSTHHKGAADFEGSGWRLGVSSSPGLATALVVAAVARIQRNHGIDLTLSGPVIYLNQQAKG